MWCRSTVVCQSYLVCVVLLALARSTVAENVGNGGISYISCSVSRLIRFVQAAWCFSTVGLLDLKRDGVDLQIYLY